MCLDVDTPFTQTHSTPSFHLGVKFVKEDEWGYPTMVLEVV